MSGEEIIKIKKINKRGGSPKSSELFTEAFQEEFLVSVDEIQLSLGKKEKSIDYLSGIGPLLNPYDYNISTKNIKETIENGMTNKDCILSAENGNGAGIPETILNDPNIKELKFKKEEKLENFFEKCYTNLYGIPNLLFREISDIVDDVYLRNYMANKDRKFNIFDTENQFIIQQYNSQNKSKVTCFF